MSATNSFAPSAEHTVNSTRADTLALLAIASIVAAVHMATNGRYGFHRDELQTLSDALHLDWGYVVYPPFTPFIERVAMALFGHSLVGLRIFSVLAQCTAIVVAGLMARELGGRRLAQITAALCVALAPLSIFEGTEFQYSSFDYLWWVLAAYFAIRVLKSDEPRWFVPMGAAIGMGLMTKYTMAFFLAGIVAGFLFTDARRWLKSAWLWTGVAVALGICLPNLIWQAHHGFVSYEFLHHIHVRDVHQGRAHNFLLNQFRTCTNLFSAPLWIAGFIWYARERRYRMLAWMYAVPLLLFFFGNGRDYYLGAAYPMLFASGAVWGEQWLARRTGRWRLAPARVFFIGLAVYGALVSAIIIPFATGGKLKDFALKNNGDLREEIGWNELVATVASIRDSLPPEQRTTARVIVGNYGEQGAVEFLGAPYQLGLPISGTNSSWYRSYPQTPPSSLIVVGWSEEDADETFTGCRLAGHNGNSLGVKNEESEDNPGIFICDGPRDGWPKFWQCFRRFG